MPACKYGSIQRYGVRVGRERYALPIPLPSTPHPKSSLVSLDGKDFAKMIPENPVQTFNALMGLGGFTMPLTAMPLTGLKGYLSGGECRAHLMAFRNRLEEFGRQNPLAFKPISQIQIGDLEVHFCRPIVLMNEHATGSYPPKKTFIPIYFGDPEKTPMTFALHEDGRWVRFSRFELDHYNRIYHYSCASPSLQVFDWRIQKELDKLNSRTPRRIPVTEDLSESRNFNLFSPGYSTARYIEQAIQYGIFSVALNHEKPDIQGHLPTKILDHWSLVNTPEPHDIMRVVASSENDRFIYTINVTGYINELGYRTFCTITGIQRISDNLVVGSPAFPVLPDLPRGMDLSFEFKASSSDTPMTIISNIPDAYATKLRALERMV